MRDTIPAFAARGKWEDSFQAGGIEKRWTDVEQAMLAKPVNMGRLGVSGRSDRRLRRVSRCGEERNRMAVPQRSSRSFSAVIQATPQRERKKGLSEVRHGCGRDNWTAHTNHKGQGRGEHQHGGSRSFVARITVLVRLSSNALCVFALIV